MLSRLSRQVGILQDQSTLLLGRESLRARSTNCERLGLLLLRTHGGRVRKHVNSDWADLHKHGLFIHHSCRQEWTLPHNTRDQTLRCLWGVWRLDGDPFTSRFIRTALDTTTTQGQASSCSSCSWVFVIRFASLVKRRVHSCSRSKGSTRVAHSSRHFASGVSCKLPDRRPESSQSPASTCFSW